MLGFAGRSAVMEESSFRRQPSWLESGHHIDVTGMRVFVHERGSGPNLLLLHGFPTSGI